MKYTLLLYGDEARYPDPDSEEMVAEFAEWAAYSEALEAAGVFVAGEGLLPVATATTLRPGPGGGRTVTSDGPFAETKEALGGFYIVDVDTIDDAIAWAEKVPTDYITVEIRPVLEVPDAP